MEFSIFPTIIIIIIFIFFITFKTINTEALVTKCSSHGDGGPEIQFPFKVKSQEQKQKQKEQSSESECGYSGFEVYCEGNKTRIEFPNYGSSLIVKSISYDEKKVSLVDPNGCVHGVFLNLNLSETPFNYYYVVRDYVYLNCTSKIESLPEVGCLSENGFHYVYVLKTSSKLTKQLPKFCKTLKKVEIPFEYTPYLAADHSFGLSFTWGSQISSSQTTTKQVVGVMSLIAAMIALLAMVIMKKYYSNEDQADGQKLVFDHYSLGTYETLNHQIN